MKKICVYTCITGNYDDLQEIEKKERNIDYYCFTNNDNIQSKTWKIVKIKDDTIPNITLARKTKILGHPIVNQYDIAVWIDASARFQKPIHEFIKKHFKETDVFSAFKHGERDNIKEECFECVRMRKETKANVKRLMNFYKKENYQYDNGLIESTVFIKRPNDKKVIETMEMWYQMLKTYSNRDQLSFNYCLSKTKLPIHWINLKVFHNEWLTHKIHNPKKVVKDCRIYYGDSSITEESYDIDLDYILPYKIKDSIYSIDTEVKKDTNVIEIEITDVYCMAYSDFNISLQCDNIYFYNTIKYYKDNIFYNSQGIARLEGNFKKGDKLSLSIKLKYLSEIEKMNFINILCNKVIIQAEEYNNLQEECKTKEAELAKIKRTISYKLYQKEEKSREKLRKFKNKNKK